MTVKGFIDIIERSAILYPKEIFSQHHKIYTCVNPFSYHIVKNQPHLYEKMDGLFVDGITMCWLINLFWKKKIPRKSFDMTSIAKDLFEWLSTIEQTIYFIGTKQELIGKSIKNIKNSYPNLKIAGYRNGYFSSNEERIKAIHDIVALNPNFVVVGMGSPIQEKFAIDLKDSGYSGIVFTCGGFIHQSAQELNYFPNWINRYHLRAFYRLIKERGLFKRLYNVLIQFPILFTKDTLQYKLSTTKKI